MKRIAALTALLMLSFQDPPAPAAPTDAEGWFKRMEETLEDAKTISCDFDASLSSGQRGATMKGSIKLKDGGNLRMEASGSDGDMEGTVRVTADGDRLSIVYVGGGEERREEEASLPDEFEELLHRTFIRAGAYVIVDLEDRLVPNKEYDVDDWFIISDITLGDTEKSSGREARLLTYTLKRDEKDEKAASVTLWIDNETYLPLKRSISVPLGERSMKIEESYTNWQLDNEIDDKEFEVE